MKKFTVIILALLVSLKINAQKVSFSYLFSHFTTNNGLSSNNINGIEQDGIGLLYIATDEGLNVYNGFGFSQVTADSYGNRLQAKYITSLEYTDNNRPVLWIGTFNNGLIAWEKSKDRFIRFSAKNELLSDIVTAIAADKNIVVAGTYRGFTIFNANTLKVISKQKLFQRINDLLVDNGNIYLATDYGLLVFNLKDKQIKTLLKNNNKILSLAKAGDKLLLGTTKGVLTYYPGTGKTGVLSQLLANKTITAIAVEDTSTYWFGTKNSGLILYDAAQITIFINDRQYEYSLSSNHITSLFFDNSHNLWIGTYMGGLNKLSDFSRNLMVLDKIPQLDKDFIQTIYEDADGNIWIGTADAQLNKWDRKNNKFVTYSFKELAQNLNADYKIRIIYEDTKGRLWIGTDGGGLAIFNPKTDRIEKLFQHNPDDPNSLSSNRIRAIVEDRKGNIWIGTFGGGLDKYLEHQDKFVHFYHNPTSSNSLICNFINTIYKDRQNRIWIGTINGLDLFVPVTGSFVHFLSPGKYPPQLRWINSILQTSDGRIWAATQGGLVQIDPINNIVTVVDSNFTNLPDNNILNLIEDQNGILWLTTHDNLISFNPKDYTVNVYNRFKGLISGGFSPGSVIKTHDGMILYANSEGLNGFYPEKLAGLKSKVKAYVKRIYVSENNSTVIHPGSKHRIFIPNLKHRIRLELDKVALDNNDITYQYKLEGFDKEWKNTKDPVIDYQDLPPKKYELKIRAIDNNGKIIDDLASVEIVVSPQIWNKEWFRLLVVVLILGFIGLMIYLRMRYYQKLHDYLNKKVDEKTRELQRINSELKKMYERVKQQNEEIRAQNEVLKHQNAEIEAQKDAIEAQSKLLQEKNEEIQASIRYALRIQKAVFPSSEQIQKIFPNHFLVFIPREIVSGDFYWAAETADGKIAVVGDCTGHGIPGAFMSILGINLLNKIIKEHRITEPARILNQLRKELINALVHEDDENIPYDGIDLSLVKINYAQNTITLAAANHTIYIITPEEAELYEYKGDRMPIGYYEIMKDFTQQTLAIRKGQIVYLFTDGYPDQFGGPYSKKFKYSRFKATLLEICSYPMQKQREVLYHRIHDWMSYPDRKHNEPRHEQIDDILIFGIKL